MHSYSPFLKKIHPCISEDLYVEQDIPNWILNESGHFTLKSAMTFFLEPGVPDGWGKFIWSSSILPSKTLVLWKIFHG